jgi:micrococcal nuclease
MDKSFLYHYAAVVVKVVDGDTVKLNIDLGMKMWLRNENVRLAGINAPEIRGEEREAGLKSKAHLEGLLPVGARVFIHTRKDKKGKYGRYIAQINYETYDINKRMVMDEHAVEKEY